MHTEIEAKLKVDSLQEIERKLDEVGAEFLEEQLQTDTYCDAADATLKTATAHFGYGSRESGKKRRLF